MTAFARNCVHDAKSECGDPRSSKLRRSLREATSLAEHVSALGVLVGTICRPVAERIRICGWEAAHHEFERRATGERLGRSLIEYTAKIDRKKTGTRDHDIAL